MPAGLNATEPQVKPVIVPAGALTVLVKEQVVPKKVMLNVAVTATTGVPVIVSTTSPLPVANAAAVAVAVSPDTPALGQLMVL